MQALARPKPFAWSFSRLKNFETCPLKYQQVDLVKAFKETKSTELDWGDQVHKTLAGVLLGQLALPEEMKAYQKWVDKVNQLPGELYVEQKYAINRQFKPTTYFADDVWFRGIGDAVKIIHNRGVIVDWKTGQIKADSVQLMLMAQCLFSHFPQLEEVYTMYIWLKEDAKTVETFTRQDLADGWLGLYERVEALEGATKANNFPPKPSGLCRKHCPVATCQYHGKGAF
jgi:RecB family exonuclease